MLKILILFSISAVLSTAAFMIEAYAAYLIWKLFG